MEIERKFLVHTLPIDLYSYPHSKLQQGYIYTNPAIRIRQKDTLYFLTVKGEGLLAREEFEVSITKHVFLDLQKKIDGILINKTRYFIPYPPYLIELDIFHDEYENLIVAEVEFPSIEEANQFIPPNWFGLDVTFDNRYQNSRLSQKFTGDIIPYKS